jgi:hypothetical protein
LSRGEVVKRPRATDGDIDEIDDQFWDLIMGCCVPAPGDRLTLLEIQKLLEEMEIQDDRPTATNLPGAEALALRSSPDIDWDGVKRLLDQIQVCQRVIMEQPLNVWRQVELLRTPLWKLIQNHTKDVAAAVAQLIPEDTQALVDFLDVVRFWLTSVSVSLIRYFSGPEESHHPF